MSAYSESINLNNGNVLDTESSAIESLSSNLYNAIKNNMNTSSLFTEQTGGAVVGRKKAGTKKGSKKGSKRAAAARAGSKGSKKAGSKKTGSKKGSKRATAAARAGSKGSKKAGSKKAGSKKGSKRATAAARAGSKGSKKAGSKKAGSKKGSKRANKNVNDLEMMGGRRKKGSKKSSRSKSLHSNTMSDSIEAFIGNPKKANVPNTLNTAQDGGKKKKGSNKSSKGSKGSKAKRELPEKLVEFQKLVKHMAASLGHTPQLFKLAKAVRDEIMKEKANANAPIQEITKKSIKSFDDNKSKWTAEYAKLKAKK